MDTILVATDFSKAASNAIDYAYNMAVLLNSALCVFHVAQSPMFIGDVPLKQQEEEIKENSELRLEELMKELQTKTDGKTPVKIEFRTGDFDEELDFLCEDINPYLVVMGSQGKSAIERFLFGNHTVHAMRHLRCPLITVPPHASFTKVRNIGLAYDFEQDINPSSFDTIRFIVKAFHAKVHVINIGKKNELITGNVFKSGELEETLSDLKPDYHFITGDDSDRGILDFVEQNEMDLLIVTPGIHGILGNLNHQSHSKQFILHSPIPVLSILSKGFSARKP